MYRICIVSYCIVLARCDDRRRRRLPSPQCYGFDMVRNISNVVVLATRVASCNYTSRAAPARSYNSLRGCRGCGKDGTAYNTKNVDRRRSCGRRDRLCTVLCTETVEDLNLALEGLPPILCRLLHVGAVFTPIFQRWYFLMMHPFASFLYPWQP